MKNFTSFHEHLINKCQVSKKLLLITAICFAVGVNAQVRLVKDIFPGSANSSPGMLYVFDNSLYFSGSSNGNSNARAIYKSDGTNAGSQALYYLQYPPNQQTIINFMNTIFYEYNSALYFDSYKDNIYQNGTGVFKLPNGSTLEATRIADFGINSNTRLFDAVGLNDKLIFPKLTTNIGDEPFVIDLVNPSNSGVLKDIESGASNSTSRGFTKFNNKVYFSAYESVNGNEIWETDGTTAGTNLFANINFGNANSDPNQFTVLGSNMVFAATNAITGRELFITDGTTAGTTILKNINVGTGDTNPSNITKIGANIYFSADNGTDGQELWKSDGTEAGTIQIKNINPTGDSNPANFIQFGSNVYFTATDGVNGVELYVTNGSPNVAILVKDINPTGDSDPRDFIVYNGKLYFTAFNGADRELWSANGNSNGTVEIDIYAGSTFSSDPTDLVVYNNELYFNANSFLYGREPHAYMDPALSVDNFNSLETSISLFPNPTNNYFEIESTETLEKVEIYSLQGQSVKSFVPQNQYDISDLSIGMYFVNIHANGNSVSKRLIKE